MPKANISYLNRARPNGRLFLQQLGPWLANNPEGPLTEAHQEDLQIRDEERGIATTGMKRMFGETSFTDWAFLSK